MVILRAWKCWEKEKIPIRLCPTGPAQAVGALARHTAIREIPATGRTGRTFVERRGMQLWRREAIQASEQEHSARLARAHAHSLFVLVDPLLLALVHFFHGFALGIAGGVRPGPPQDGETEWGKDPPPRPGCHRADFKVLEKRQNDPQSKHIHGYPSKKVR